MRIRRYGPIRRLQFIFCAAVIVLACCGCDGNRNSQKVDKIEVISGEDQCVRTGQFAAEPLTLELLGPVVPGVFGGKGERHPVAGAQVRFETEIGSELTLDPSEAVSDSGGAIRTRIRADGNVGDHYFRIVPVDAPEKSRRVRVVCGVSLSGDNQEGICGRSLANPIRVQVTNETGEPI
jgi:hypothetical protein